MKSCSGDMAKEEGQSSSSLNSNSNSHSRDKQSIIVRPRVPFHIATIPRPQEEYNIRANNLNEPFQHVWLETSEDGSRFIHPLEKFSELDFADQNVVSVDPVKPLPMECTSFKLVENLKDLKELVAKLHAVNEFAVDLEHNKYRSFQGLTCLMQISTRIEDFVVDTLKLRIHIGPFLREFFKDPSKKKVMHGADCDILWLQRDFSIYVCNLFDTGQASRVLQLERNSLEYLLSYFCGVFVNKDYQHADWRQRPLSDEMLKYARQDTHYLFYLHDIMKGRLISESRSCEDGNDLLLEVYKRSYDVCLQLYEKELFTDMSYLYTYGLQGADFNAQQLSVVAGLCEWRDTVSRQVDESTGYILPNKALLDIARQMPLTSSKLRRLVKSKHPHVEWNLISVLDVIKDSIQKASAFERAAQELQKGPQEMVTEQKTVVSNAALQGSEEVPIYMLNRHFQLDTNRVNGQATKPHLTTTCIHVKEDSLQFGGRSEGNYFELSGNGGEVQKEAPFILKESSISRQMRDSNIKMADVRPDKTEKMDQIKTIILPFDLLDGRNKTLQ